MAVRAHRRSKSARILVPATVNPTWRRVAEVITGGQGLKLDAVPYDPATGCIDANSLAPFAGEDITAIVVQQPNFFGQLEDVDALTRWARANGALVIAAVNPVALALVAPPGEWGDGGADIAVRRRPALRRAAVLGRALRRVHGLPHGARAPDARAHRGPHRGHRGQARLHADAAGARAAHPARQGDLEHLHQPGPADDRGDDPPRAARAGGPRARRARLPRAHGGARRRAHAGAGRPGGLPGPALPRGRAEARPARRAGARGARGRGHRRRPRPRARFPGARRRAPRLRDRDAHDVPTSRPMRARSARVLGRAAAA